MATTDTQQPSSSWDEERCKAALAQLERLQTQATQLDDLRMTIPRVVEPFNSNLTSGPVIYKQFSTAAVSSQNNIKAFRAQWQSPETQSILNHAKESLEKSDDLSAGAQVAKFGWVQSELAEKEKTSRSKHDKKDIADDKLDKETIGKMLEEFKTANSKTKIETKDGNRDILFSFVADGLRLKFRVTIEEEAGGRRKVNAECMGTAKPFSSISRSVASRPQANDLKYLLDMIAAYKNIRATTCAKCQKLLDSSATVPTARRSKPVANGTEPPQTVWEAFHESCLG
ncbi:mediator complex subunit 27-domain-containing protein [Lophiotrema nucula]|uniref:Mediator complex subunit 27-domain-containing protein n=1 Tax=Lophiotrema nucula TaxID=690887 RepID=A0A6A5Z8M1_9PLEO|nr:mediator complex subunit 27-domain-containing protein [Lophiotrema nucula]